MRCWVDTVLLESAEGHRLVVVDIAERLLRLAKLAEESGVKGAEAAAFAMKSFAMGLQLIAREAGGVLRRCEEEGASLAISMDACRVKNLVYEFMRRGNTYRHPALATAYDSALQSLGALYAALEAICNAGGRSGSSSPGFFEGLA